MLYYEDEDVAQFEIETGKSAVIMGRESKKFMTWLNKKKLLRYMKFKILKNQQWTLLFIILFLTLFYLVLPIKTFMSGTLWGISTLHWAIISILFAIAHQVYVLLCWRLEIYHSTNYTNF